MTDQEVFSVANPPSNDDPLVVEALVDGKWMRARYLRVNWKGDYGEWWVSEDYVRDPVYPTKWRYAND